MTVESRFAELLERLAAFTSVRRTRVEDEVRVGRHGGSGRDLEARKEQFVRRLESVVSKVEG